MRAVDVPMAISSAYDDPRWQGYGYLGERRHAVAIDPALVALADGIVAEEVERRGWSHDVLFHWMNSKPGRWFGDVLFGGDGESLSREQLVERVRVLFDREEEWLS